MIDQALERELQAAATSVAALANARPDSLATNVVILRQHLERAAKQLRDPAATAPRATLFEQLASVIVHRRLPPRLGTGLHRLRKRLNHLVHDDLTAATPGDVSDGARTILDLYAHVGVLPHPDSSNVAVQRLPTLTPVVWRSWELTELPEEDLTGIQRLAVIASEQRLSGAGVTIICLHENDDNPIRVDLTPDWSSVALYPGSAICTHRLERVARGHWKTTNHSLVVLEPDVLVQATDVANSFSADTASPLFALADIITPRTTSPPMVLGTVANTLFDEMVAEQDGSAPSELAHRALMAHEVALAELSPADEATVRSTLMNEQMSALELVAARLRELQATIEPTMMSASFGLQGRPDVVANRPGRLPLVLDLKTGKPPAQSEAPAHEALRTSLGVRAKDAAQLVCYSLLLRSAGFGPKSDLCVFYSRAIAEPMQRPGIKPPAEELFRRGVRRVHSSAAAERAVMVARNEIVALELRLIAGGDGESSSALRIPSRVPPFSRDGLARASEYVELALSPRNETDRYLGRLSRHVFRTMWTERLGGPESRHGNGGFSSLWLETNLREKSDSYSTLAYLAVDRGGDRASDVVFRLTNDDFRDTELREQDRVIVFPHAGDRIAPLEGPLLRGEIAAIDTAAGSVTIRFYSSSARLVLQGHPIWAAHKDYSESLTRAPLAGVVSLMGRNSGRVNLLMGLEAPQKSPALSLAYESRDAMTEIVAKIAAAEDYFLVQGPPGTGKTNVLLPEIVRSVLAADRGPVLALAFTNRAVGEMRSALRRERFSVDPLYRGDRSPGTVSAESRVSTIRAELAATQVYVMTVASALRRLGWLKAMKFDTVIVDESSQLLDSQLLGILSLVRRFVLIGDERQLPPVQPVRLHSDPDEVVDPIQLSTFERLLTACKQEGWTHAYGMLKSQWRMHEEIQKFPSEAFYDGQLHIGPPERQSAAKWNRLSGLPGHWTDALLRKRVTFVAVPVDDRQRSRTHEYEATVVARIAKALQERLQAGASANGPDRATIGVIAPFRAQVAAIRRELSGAAHIDVDTVERYQGSQRDVIIISSTADNDAERQMTESLSLDGLVDRKFNVAITRPREHLIVVGHESTMASGRHSSAWLEHVRQHGAWLNAIDLGLADDAIF